MTLLAALITGMLAGGAIYLLLRRRAVPLMLGGVLLGPATVLFLFAVNGGLERATTGAAPDALLGAMLIVVLLAMAVLALCLVGVVLRGGYLSGSEHVDDMPPPDAP